jgi:hypothetical protein
MDLPSQPSFSLLSLLDRLIKEYTANPRLRDELTSFRDYTARLGKQNADLERQAAKLEAKLEILERANQELKADHQRLKDELDKERQEQARYHKGLLFRNGKKTNGKWIPFCGACEKPLYWSDGSVRCVFKGCESCFFAYSTMEEMILELG